MSHKSGKVEMRGRRKKDLKEREDVEVLRGVMTTAS